MFNQSRSYIIRILFAVAFLVMIGQLVNLQIVSSKYKEMARNNAVLQKTVYPPRGIVFDRKNKRIVNNVLRYDLMVIPSKVKNVDTSYICQLLEIDTAEFNSRMVTAIIKNGRFRPSPFESLLTEEKHARVDENLWRMGDGFYLQERPVRTFPNDCGGSFMGYIGEVDSGIIARSQGFYQPGDYVGRTGLEAYYEKTLMGQRGVQFLVKDNYNRIVGPYQNGEFDDPPIAGKDLHTAVDIDVQKLAEKLLANKIGAVVALDPKTGGIISMASGPVYNPNDLTGSSFRKTYGKFVLDVSRPLLNRAIKGQYPAGSTYKPVGALIGLDEGVITQHSGIECRGKYYGCAKPVGCTEKWAGHSGNLRDAIAYSCNSFFCMTYRLTVDNPRLGGVKKGYARWRDYVTAFGYGAPLGVDIPSENGGLIPDTARYNRIYRGSWNSCTNVTLGIGQDQMLVTPLQIANVMAIIANKGSFYTPHFVTSIEGDNADTVLQPYKKLHKLDVHVSDTSFNTVIDGMEDVTIKGTAASIPKIPGVNVCAKTGTAQNFHNGVEQKEHSIFACFAPRENPKICVAVIIENGGFGSTWAGPIAYLLMEQYLTDSLRASSKLELDRIAGTNLLPGYLPRDQWKEDSLRARFYFKLKKDSSYIRKYLKGYYPEARPVEQPKPADTPSKPREQIVLRQKPDMIDEKLLGAIDNRRRMKI